MDEKSGGPKTYIDLRQIQAHIGVMRTATAVAQWQGPKNGVRLAPIMSASYYPVDEESGEERVRTSVRLSQEQHADIELITKLWNDLDRVLGRQRSRKWKAASVIERLVAVGIDGFWAQVGGRPDTREGREDFIRQAAEKLNAERQKKSHTKK